MKISFVEIQNFRKLKQCKIEFGKTNTLFVGPNNSGKTSAMEALEKFLGKKNFNFKGWGIFHELYKTETLIYYIENFIIMNMPAIGRGLFKIRRGFKKLKR